MGLGSTTKKIQVLAERAEQMYKQVGELRDQIQELRETVEETGDRVEGLDRRSAQQWEVMQAMAEELDVDVDAVLTDAAIEDLAPVTEEVEDAEEPETDETLDEDDGNEG